MSRFLLRCPARRRWFIIAALVALPLVLYGILAEHVSWYPHTLCKGIIGDELSIVANGTLLLVDGRNPNQSPPQTLQVWDISRSTLSWQLPDSKDSLFCFAASSANTIVAAATTTGIQLWDVQRGKRLGQLNYPTPTSHMENMVFSPDGKALVALSSQGGCASPYGDGSCEARLILWDVTTQKYRYTLLRQQLAHKYPVREFVYSPNGDYIAGSNWEDCYIWNARTGRLLWKHTGAFAQSDTGLAFSPDSRILAAMDHNTLRFWDMATGRLKHRATEVLKEQVPGAEIAPRLAFLPDGQRLIVHDEWSGDLVIVSSASGQVLRHVGNLSYKHVALSMDNKTLALANGNVVVLYDMNSKQRYRRLKVASNDDVTALTFTPDGNTLITASDDSIVKLWRVR